MKYLLYSILFVSTVQIAHAQENKFEVGIEAGPNVTSVLNQSPEDFLLRLKPGVGYQIGGAFQYNFHPILSLRTGLHYQMSNPSYKDIIITDDLGTDMGRLKMNYQLHYLAIPLLLRATFGQRIQGFVNAGVSTSFLVGSNFRSDFRNNAGESESYFEEQDNSAEPFNPFQIGAVFGFGVHIPVGNQFGISLEVSNQYNFNSIYNTNYFNLDDFSMKGNANITRLSVGFNYKF